MPGSNHGPSILNPKVYEALRKKRGMSKRRAAMISNAQRHKDSGIADLAIPPHGPNALFNQPGIAQRRRRKCYKAFNWGAHVGQAINGRLTRGEGGRFSGDGQAPAAKPPSKSHERRDAVRAARQQRMDAIRAARVQEQADENAKRAEEDVYIAGGKSGRERQQRRAEVAAARRDRANARRAAHQKQIEDERATRAQEDAAPVDEEAAGAEPKKGGGGGGGGKKKPSDEEKRAAQEQKRTINRQTTASKAGLSTDEADWLAGVASGTPPTGSFDGRHLAELGLTQDTGDATEATDAGRRLLNALERGDVRGALAAIQDGKARLARERARVEQRRQRDAAKQVRIAQRRQKRPKPSPRQTTKAQSDEEKAMFANMGGGKGSGGGGGKSTLWTKDPETGKRAPNQSQVDRMRDHESALYHEASETYSKIRKLRDEQAALQTSWGQKLKPKYAKERQQKHDELERQITELRARHQELNRQTEHATRARRKYEDQIANQTTKAQATFGGQPRADLADSVFAGPDRSFPIKTAQDVRDAVRSLGRTKHDKAAVRRGIIRRARSIGATAALPESWRSMQKDDRGSADQANAPHDRDQDEEGFHGIIHDPSIASSFAVFKDAAGRDRWAAITTTAYQDKDGEWIGTKAIRGVVEAGDRGTPRGPLRFWHVPGLDLGDCDYQATAYGDRFLIESGTFRNPAAARIGAKAAARGYQMSPGFLHTHREPLGGLYEHIALFERSMVPPGRAANPGTSFITKGDRMLTDEKKKEFEALAGDAEGRALLESLLTQAATTVKNADEAGAVYKDAPAWAQALIGRMETMEERLKAMPPMAKQPAMDDLAALDAEDDPAQGGDSGVDESTEQDMGGMDDEGFADLLVQKLMAALGPMLDLEKKVAGYLDSMKGMLQPMQQKDDTRAKEIADLQARLKELEGGQPRARTSLASGVWGQLSGISVTKEQASAITAKTPGDEAPPPNLTPQEQGAWNLIWGDNGTMPQG